MQTKRLIVYGVSLVVAAVLTWVIIYLYIPLGPIVIGFGTDIKKFEYSFAALLFVSIAGIFGVWLDYFLDTQILKH